MVLLIKTGQTMSELQYLQQFPTSVFFPLKVTAVLSNKHPIFSGVYQKLYEKTINKYSLITYTTKNIFVELSPLLKLRAVLHSENQMQPVNIFIFQQVHMTFKQTIIFAKCELLSIQRMFDNCVCACV